MKFRKSFRNCEENFKYVKELCEKMYGCFEENLRKLRESLENCGENFKEFSGNIKKLWREF